MFIKLISDVHEEFRYGTGFYKLELPEDEQDKDTCLIVAGDLNTSISKSIESLTDWCNQFKYVVFVLGNHDYWHKTLWDPVQEMRMGTQHLKNLFVLEDEFVILDGINIWGSTLWSDALRDPTREYAIRKHFIDYHRIYNNKTEFITPTETTKKHKLSVYLLQEEFLRKVQGPKVVVTHHAPSELSSLPMFKNSEFNPCFFTDLTHLMEQYDIDYWMHGHMHNTSDYEIYGTRVLCNPVGYIVQNNEYFNPRMLVDVTQRG